MDRLFDNFFIIKQKKIKSVIDFLNKEIEKKIIENIFYAEDSAYFDLNKLKLKIDNVLISNNIILKKSFNYYPNFIILKGKKINDIVLKKDEWIIVNFEPSLSFISDNKIYAFSLF